MAGFNRVVLVGNLTRDPDYKQLSSGQGVCRLGLAVNRQYKNRQTDTMVQEVCYVDIDVWGAQAESCRQYLQKGREILIEGRLKLDTWEDPTGQKRSKHSVVADRVVFLNNSGNSEQSDSEKMYGATQDGPRNEAEKELFDQIDAVKSRNKKTKKESKPDTGEVDFQDEPPFEDELPF